ncbi:hypothetical protein QC761_0050010 [Podospora bellae-mahoneyi]|uniref:CPAF-like PDZ domain-containing protein n=1 Tax=Podospora bellae-mahoneyi TaxID=2093777 RepID=A0ABR0FKE0_9PEZI|nr:hypothetical protein QC761_0050010 [Podospora bellae-mahoneyi]
MGGLDKIASRVSGDEKYASEYDFAMPIYELIGASHDGHFRFVSDVFRGFFFVNTLVQDLATISINGTATPKLTTYLSGTSSNGTLAGSQLPPAIVQINGKDAVDVLMKQQLRFSDFQSLDALWNAGMPSYAGPHHRTLLTNSMDYQGQNLTLTYVNGQEVTVEPVAIVRMGANFTDVRTGEGFYTLFCDPDASIDVEPPATTEVPPQFPTSTRTDTAASDVSSTNTLPPLSPTISNYPWPAVRDNGSNITSGYCLNGTGYDDIVVLALSEFSPPDMDPMAYLVDFQATIANLLAKSREQTFSANNIRETLSVVQISNVSSADAVEIKNLDANTFDEINPNEPARFKALSSLHENSMVEQLIPGHLFSPITGLNLTTSDALLGQ